MHQITAEITYASNNLGFFQCYPALKFKTKQDASIFPNISCQLFAHGPSIHSRIDIN